MGAHLSEKKSLRLDVPTLEALEEYRERNGMSFSQALRVLLALALREEGESSDAAFRAAAFREGVLSGVASVSVHVQKAVKAALDELEGRRQ